MEDTASELTQVSSLTKRQRGLHDTVHTLDLTEVTDFTENVVRPPTAAAIVIDDAIIKFPMKENADIINSEEIDEEVMENQTKEDIGLNDDKISLPEVVSNPTDGLISSTLDTEYNSQSNKDIMQFIIQNTKIEKETEVEITTNISSIVSDVFIDEAKDEGKQIETEFLLTKSVILPISEISVEDESKTETTLELSIKKKELMQRERHELINKLKEALFERDEMTEDKEILEIKLAKYFKRKRPDASRKMIKQLEEKESSMVDKEEKYGKYLLTIEHLQKVLKKALSETKISTETKIFQLNERDNAIIEKFEDFSKYQQKIGSMAANSYTGKKIPSADLEAFYSSEIKKDAIVRIVRLENIKLKNDVVQLSSNLFAKESVTKKLNLVDFEQLKIENISFDNKLEERHDSIVRLIERVSNNAHKISHTKEKLQHVRQESKFENEKQKEITEKFNMARITLTKKKSERDEVIKLKNKIIKSGGLFGHKQLLFHYEDTMNNMKKQQRKVFAMSKTYDLFSFQKRKIKDKLRVINGTLS